MFESEDGIVALTPSLSIENIGLEVRRYTDTQTITGVNTFTDTQEIVWTSDGYALCYSYLWGLWSAWNGHECDASASNWFIDGYDLKKSTPGVYHDDGAWIDMSATSPWVAMERIGYSRLLSAHLLGIKYSDGYIEVGIGYDYNPELSNERHIIDTRDIPNGDWFDLVGAGPDEAPELFKIWPLNTRATAYRFEIKDREPPDLESDDGYQGSSFTAIGFEYRSTRSGARTQRYARRQ
jgi:hypothetical protein